ncbi:DUF222 domain-containing protein [Brachybacterium sp. GCM10030268]|uniref:HNH endonuclease signature motif containing protein n=1 Tax=Brachybacterium sp. GCM10030268 TaxID=3273382 RepID=UPI00361B8A39
MPTVPPLRARKPLTEERILEAAEAEPGSEQADRVQAIHAALRAQATAYARQLERICEFFTADDEAAGSVEDSDLVALKLATAMRCSTSRAETMIRHAHRAIDQLPAVFAFLDAGDLPEDWHRHLLRKTAALNDEKIHIVDTHVSSWDLANISRDQFDRRLRYLIDLLTADALPEPPEAKRQVAVEIDDERCGTATMLITGPIPEIIALMHRIDTSALTVQQAQRQALRDGQEGPLPFDIDEDLRERGRAKSLAELRYAVLTHSMLSIDPVQERGQQFTLNVTVPALTLLGASNAPGLIEGQTPIPAEQARVLAANEDATWHRILTDPATGAFLPTAATTYKPSAQMCQQLRLRHPVCAAPGCRKATALSAENDHIQEFNHHHPTAGGLTTLVNLHRLCWRHHQLKTSRRIDPERDTGNTRAPSGGSMPDNEGGPGNPAPDPRGPGNPSGTGRAAGPENDDSNTFKGHDRADPFHGSNGGPLETRWSIDLAARARTREETDLATPHLVAALNTAWNHHERVREHATRAQERDAQRSDAERTTEKRRERERRFLGKRPDPTPPPPPSPEDDEPPPF